ncbi:hypothetical protein [Bacteroides bouchesdurhonensis]
MKPLWIIDICEGKHSRLEECITFINQQKKQNWIYSRLDIEYITDLASYVKARNYLLKEARMQINRLLQLSGLNTNTFPVCVLGDITSERTRSFLPFISILLKRNWTKVLPAHIGIGISVGTFIYIPTNVNQHEMYMQRKYATFLEELDMLHVQTPAEMYDYIVPYGDIQPIGKQAYPKLNICRQEELIFQFLLNLYYSGASAKLPITPPGGNRLFCNLGAASYFYDADYTRKQMARQILKQLLKLFRQKTEEVDPNSELYSKMEAETKRLVEVGFIPEFMAAQSIQSTIACNQADITVDLEKMDREKELHPVFHFWKPLLYSCYFLRELKFLPARLNEYLQFYVQSLRQKVSTHLQSNKIKIFEKTRQTIDNVLVNFWESTDYKYKTLGQVEEFLHKVIDCAEAEKKRLKIHAAVQEVSPIIIPRFLQPHVEEIRNSKESINVYSILDELKATLQKEPTFLSAVVRCMLVGTAGIFCILPLLKFLSPRVVNFGEVVQHESLWIALIYIIPFVYTLWWGFRRHFRLVKKLKNKLWAFVLCELKGQMTAKLTEESMQYYNMLKEYCEKKLIDCERLRGKYEVSFDVKSEKFIETFFNRSIDEFIFDKSLIEERIEVEGREYMNAGKLTEDNLYYLLARSITGVGGLLFAPLPEEEVALKQKVEQDMVLLFESLQKNFVYNENAEIHRLIEHCSGLFGWQACIDLSYPVGIFVDNISQDEKYIFRISRSVFLPDEMQKIDWEIDTEGDKNIMFVTVFKHVDKLVLSRFFNEEVVRSSVMTDLIVELACYYAFYDEDSRQAGRIGTQIVSHERLREMDKVLSNWEGLA